ncbi:endonuclease/exonuclease/phosphatase family protein [Shivajiella indica]|uniref:Endonuclease/exonuclease/phosphatase family protein n=1 Tax=Shivajiella indica TaxID=872115 RepID=A0ABW5BE75_9BACT
MKKWFLRVLMVFPVWWSTCFSIMAQQNELVLLSYNIYHGEDQYQPGKSNIREIAELINGIKPDLVALQEVDSMTNRTKDFYEGEKKDLVLELENLTGMKGFFAKALDFSGGGYGEAILSRFPARFENIQLPTPKGGEGRSVALAHITLQNGRKVSFAGTHLCHEYEENRVAQVESIKDLTKGIENPVILTGDFNFEPDEMGYSILAKEFKDAALEFSNPQMTYSSKSPDIRIDYFWLDNKTNWGIISVEALDVEFSDHKPLLIKVRIID